MIDRTLSHYKVLQEDKPWRDGLTESSALHLAAI